MKVFSKRINNNNNKIPFKTPFIFKEIFKSKGAEKKIGLNGKNDKEEVN